MGLNCAFAGCALLVSSMGMIEMAHERMRKIKSSHARKTKWTSLVQWPALALLPQQSIRPSCNYSNEGIWERH